LLDATKREWAIDIPIVCEDVSLAQDHFRAVIKIKRKCREVHGYAFEQLLRDAYWWWAPNVKQR
jgi:hypothetical protein